MTELATQVAPPAADPVPAQPDTDDAVVDDVNVDAVARAVQACAGVSALSGGRFGGVASYLPGRRVPGVTVRSDAVEIQVRARWGVPARDLYSQIASVLGPMIDRRIDVVVADIDDPPSTAAAVPAQAAMLPEPRTDVELPAETRGAPSKSDSATRAQSDADEMGTNDDDERAAKDRLERTGEPQRDSLGNEDGAS
jgi:hypothetical protein